MTSAGTRGRWRGLVGRVPDSRSKGNWTTVPMSRFLWRCSVALVVERHVLVVATFPRVCEVAHVPPEKFGGRTYPCFWSLAAVGPVVAALWRRETSAPASGGIRQKRNAVVADTSATMMKAGWKSAAVILSAPRQ